MAFASTHDFPHDADDQHYLMRTSTYEEECHDHHRAYRRSRGDEDPHASTSMAWRQTRRAPSIPPLHFESAFVTTSFEDAPLAPLPSANLKRSSHIRRKDAPPKPKRPRALKRVPTRIVTDFSKRLHLPPTPPLSFGHATPSPPPSSDLSTPPPEETIQCDSPGSWGRSPGSAYSVLSARGASIYVEWDTTGYLEPVHPDAVNEDLCQRFGIPDEPMEQEGGMLKRQKTEVIVKLLKERRRKAGLD